MPFSVVNLKAYGDFVIASGAIRRIKLSKTQEVPNLIVGEHVRSLASSLNLKHTVEFIGGKNWNDVPAVFNIRKLGVLAAFKNIIEIRRSLHNIPTDTQLIFDRLGWRERLLGGGFTVHELSRGDNNIYIAYDNFFKSLGFELSTETMVSRTLKKAIIIPGARMSHRVIPAEVMSAINVEMTERSILTEVLILDGELFDLPANIRIKRIPRLFDRLVEEISNSDLVISADSLPSHLSEYLKIPIFVSTPKPKPYWLPLSSFKNNGWATFANTHQFKYWLESNFTSLDISS
jgi:ADP-heptose:LPS heptosyltransferase